MNMREQMQMQKICPPAWNPSAPQFVNCLTSRNTDYYVTTPFTIISINLSILGYRNLEPKFYFRHISLMIVANVLSPFYVEPLGMLVAPATLKQHCGV